MPDDINPAMITLARESHGLTQGELAARIDASQTLVSMYEAGLRPVSDNDLVSIARETDFPVDFFLQTDRVYGFGSSCFYHRKRKRMSVNELRRIQAKLNIFRFHVTRLLRNVNVDVENKFPRLDVEDFGGPEAIARTVRASWGLKLGRVPDVIEAIEGAGAIVFAWSFGTQNLDAISQVAPGCPPLIFVNADIPGDRLRFTLMHEIGHIVMHQIPTDNMEDEADKFAAEFLMPAKEIKSSLRNLSLNDLPALKMEWKAAMSAIIKRASDLGQISDRKARSLFVEMSKNGWKTREPVRIPVERPSVFDNILKVHLNDLGLTDVEISRMVNANLERFRRYLGTDGAPTALKIVG